MKNIVIFFLLFLISISCNQQDAWDCIQKSGDQIEQVYELENFTKIRVNRGVELILQQADTQSVSVETGENLLGDIDVRVEDNQLIISDLNNCNLVRDGNNTKAFVSSPNIEEIVCSTQYPISSEGILEYDKLNLVSENYQKPDVYSVGDFDLSVKCDKLNVFSNAVSVFDIEGEVNELFIGFYSGVGRFEGKSLIAENIRIFHDGQNDILVYPQLSLKGQIRSTGNVISYNQPLDVDLSSLYHGELIFVGD